ncbi:unnamed protein product [Rotaria socialis]|uniref:EGF-like domain-containing protein n=1 Tax=Rotaria socialis TaxID=392032 RepID=A0A821MHG3_9BILA|nr:unnamed protein product [Rotaria socialis]CAF4768581.1 unnamed protein product [Rotaria socialis]
MADLYANVFYNRSLVDNDGDRFVCNCTIVGTFGKYCEYQLTHEADAFAEAITAQFEQKRTGDSWDTQRYGKILCYETLRCPSSPLCLDWREICDGIQRCSNGTDEENCDKLEFNECEDGEFRCTNGMCIPEEFWLDGDFDCMDWSDEHFMDSRESCSFVPNAIECDERLCFDQSYSCGDGQCVSWETRIGFQQIGKEQNDCFNKQSGLCWSDKDYNDLRYPRWNMINASSLTDDEKCQYLLRCALSRGLEYDCPCNHRNCTQLMIDVCQYSEHLIAYPPEALINSCIFMLYNYSRSMEHRSPQFLEIFGDLKCRGYVFHSKRFIRLSISYIKTIPISSISHVLCTIFNPDFGYLESFPPYHNNEFCWNDSLTFNGRPYAVEPDVCTTSGECISQYRINDGSIDCMDRTDEKVIRDKNHCTDNVGRHRFQCFNGERKCLPLRMLANGQPQCSNRYDESWYGTGTYLILQIPCFKGVAIDCRLLKQYITQSSFMHLSNNISFVYLEKQEPRNLIPFQSYCDSIWDLDKHVDEIPSSCRYWICQDNEYQCRTGQCIPFDWVCDGEWDCSDASDEEAFVLIESSSIHNARLPNLPSQFEKCRKLYSNSSFSNICNTSFEFGCYLSGVSNPLNITLNHLCINLTQIGNNVEDCYNAYDEKNTFTANSNVKGMWGFHFRCRNDHKRYIDACDRWDNCTHILCSNYHDKNGSCSGPKDFICPGDDHCKKNARCNGTLECLNGEDEYWCPSSFVQEGGTYRIQKRLISLQPGKLNSSISFPPTGMVNANQQQLSKAIINVRNDQSFKAHSYQCSRGIAVLEMNEIRCLCPPAYYGDWCEFFSDRISIIAHVNQTISNSTLKIKANFLFNNKIIDHHEFHVIPILNKNQIIKHKFYLLYSRSTQMLTHKKERYLNRSDVINNHPYSVHFDAFTLEKNNSIEEIGSWHYPIYFDYLPVFRLAVVLKFPSWLGNEVLGPCWQNSCNENSICMPVFNQNNSYYCSCKSGYYGTNCSMYEPLCETYCLANALCRPNDSDLQMKKHKIYCICPSDHFGPRCSLKYDGCDSNPCLNNGTCFPNYDPSGENAYRCVCSQHFSKYQCQNEKANIHIDLNMTKSLSFHATVVQLYYYVFPSLPLFNQHQQLFNRLPSSISYYFSDIYVPQLGVLKIYEDLSHPQYFLIYFLSNQHKINITSSPQHCPHTSILLSERINNSVAAVFKYHHICRNDTERVCFYDQNYFCICQQDHDRAECFIRDIEQDRCHQCLSGGTCLQGDLKDPNDFICLCPSCHQGHRCEFSMQAFGFTLDSLIVNYLKPVKIIYASIACLLFIIGL